MSSHQEKIFQIALSITKGLGPSGYRMIMDEFTHASELFALTEDQLIEHVSKKSIRKAILNKTHLTQAEAELEYCIKNGIQVLFFKDPEYPQRLNFYDNLPCVLYYKGSGDLNHSRIVSIVGMRDASESGKSFCEKIVKDLAKHDCMVVSGLAYGIDIVAHKSSLKSDLATVGIMATGQNTIYPADHRKTADKMISNGGLLTEIRHDEEIVREMFPMRNRIVAALCDVIIVVQSGPKGGSLITARFGKEYNKPVFAVPGRPTDKESIGCNQLIKDRQAFLYNNISDLESKMNWKQKSQAVQTSLFKDLTDQELKIIEYIRHVGEAHVDDIHSYLKQPAGSLAAALLTLELHEHIRSLPGNRYICN